MIWIGLKNNWDEFFFRKRGYIIIPWKKVAVGLVGASFGFRRVPAVPSYHEILKTGCASFSDSVD